MPTVNTKTIFSTHISLTGLSIQSGAHRDARKHAHNGGHGRCCQVCLLTVRSLIDDLHFKKTLQHMATRSSLQLSLDIQVQTEPLCALFSSLSVFLSSLFLFLSIPSLSLSFYCLPLLLLHIDSDAGGRL